MKSNNGRILLASSILLALGMSANASAQTFYEGFDISDPGDPRPGCNTGDFPGGAGTYPYPSTWLLRNVDNRTPNAQVSYVNEAWEVREDFSFDVTECAAFSTSYYSPAGAADDWTWTPLIALPAGTSSLSWRAVAYDAAYADGYEVRAMRAADGPPTGGAGAIGNQATNSTQLFAIAAELSNWTDRTVALAGYEGEQIYIGFRNNSNDKFLLLIDDVKVLDETPNITASMPMFSSPYPRVAYGIPVDANLSVNARNSGGSPLTNVSAAATILRDGVAVGSPILSTPVSSLAIGADQLLTFPMGFTFDGLGEWSVEYELSANESPSEINLADNVVEAAKTAIGSNELARHELPATGSLGIGAGDGGELGVRFDLLSPTSFSGIRFAMGVAAPATPPDPEWSGRELIANLRAYDNVLGEPGAILATTIPVTSTNEGGTYDVLFVGGPQILASGSYVVTVSEPVGGPAMPLLQTAQRFVEMSAWVNWPSSPFGGWANPEVFGPAFASTPNISLLSEVSLFRDGFESTGVAVHPARIAAPERPMRKPAPTQIAPVRAR